MIELRWITRDGEKVLQYRIKTDSIFYAGLGPFDTSQRDIQWSHWIDVPEGVEDNTVAFQPYKGCPVCGLGKGGEVTGYVCYRNDCPTKVTC